MHPQVTVTLSKTAPASGPTEEAVEPGLPPALELPLGGEGTKQHLWDGVEDRTSKWRMLRHCSGQEQCLCLLLLMAFIYLGNGMCVRWG